MTPWEYGETAVARTVPSRTSTSTARPDSLPKSTPTAYLLTVPPEGFRTLDATVGGMLAGISIARCRIVPLAFPLTFTSPPIFVTYQPPLLPDDIAVVGFDGMDEGAYFSPSLTTVRRPLRELGRMAVPGSAHGPGFHDGAGNAVGPGSVGLSRRTSAVAARRRPGRR